ncbi:unnamed protein product [Discosporangium mesarthrocarpum]
MKAVVGALLGVGFVTSPSCVDGFRISSTPQVPGLGSVIDGGSLRSSSQRARSSPSLGWGMGGLSGEGSPTSLGSTYLVKSKVTRGVATGTRKRKGGKRPNVWEKLRDADIGLTDKMKELSEKLSAGLPYLDMDEAMEIQQALKVAIYAHSNGGQRSDYEHHVRAGVDVCLILGKLEMGTDALLSAIISGVLRPHAKPHGFGGPTITIGDIEQIFGFRVARLVANFEQILRLEEKAVNRIGMLTAKEDSVGATVEDSREQVDKAINLILSEVEEWEVLTLHLANHMHLLRSAIRNGGVGVKAKKLARQALDIHAPLAHRLGVHFLSSGLEDLAFKALYPKEYKEVQRATEDRMDVYKEVLESTMETVSNALKDDISFSSQLEGDVIMQHRIKEPYSMWKKMQRQPGGVEGVQDAVALRVVLKARRRLLESDESYTARSEALCYQAMEIAQELYHSVGGRFKDYVSFPKANGYQSLHSTNLFRSSAKEGEDGEGEAFPFEFQVRTAQMHHRAEYGHASHWSYKTESRNSLSWMGAIDTTETSKNAIATAYSRPKATGIPGQGPGRAAVPESVSSGRDLVTWLHRELQQRKVFVFGPDNLIWELDKTSSTAADVLLGNTIFKGVGPRSARVNGRKVPMHHPLKNGDVLAFQTTGKTS